MRTRKKKEVPVDWKTATTVPEFTRRYIDDLLVDELQLLEMGMKDLLREAVTDTKAEVIHPYNSAYETLVAISALRQLMNSRVH